MNAPKNIYNYFYMFIYIRPFIWSCAQFLHIHFEMKPIIPYICFFILPRFIIAIVLLIEVIFFNYIRCFYNLLGLLVIPLLFKIILYMIEHHSTRCLDILLEYFTFKLIEDTNELEITFKTFNDPIKLQEQKKLLPQAEENWMAYQNMYSICIRINSEKEKYDYIANIIIYGILTIAFSIYVFKIMGFFISSK